MAIASMVLGAIAGCQRDVSRVHTVAIREFLFTPTEMTVAVGDTVAWTNGNFVPHTAIANDAGWDSKAIAANGSWRLVAQAPGRQTYDCASHPVR